MVTHRDLTLTPGAGSTGHITHHQVLHRRLLGGNYFVYNHGGDMTSDIQEAANDADSDGGGTVEVGNGQVILGTATRTNRDGDKCNVEFAEVVRLVGQGMGNNRSGGSGTAGQNAATEFMNTATASLSGGQKHIALSWTSTTANPDWRGAGVSHCGVEDDVGSVDRLVETSGLNDFMAEYVSFGRNSKSGSWCLVTKESRNAEWTQYHRFSYLNVWSPRNGIWLNDQAADTEMRGCQIQHSSGGAPVGTGLKVSSNACRVWGGELQFWDICLDIDGSVDDAGRHNYFNRIHFEGLQGTSNVGANMVRVRKNHNNKNQFNTFRDCESDNHGAYTAPFVFDTGTRNNAFRGWYVRGQRFIGDSSNPISDSLVTDNGIGNVATQS